MNFRRFSQEEICHGMIIGGNEKKKEVWEYYVGGGGFLSISHFYLAQILFNLPTGKKIFHDGNIHWCLAQSFMKTK